MQFGRWRSFKPTARQFEHAQGIAQWGGAGTKLGGLPSDPCSYTDGMEEVCSASSVR